MTALLIETRGRVRHITLNRPERHNAFDDALIAGLTAAFQAAGGDDGVGAVVLRGAGKSFSAGADLDWMARMARYSHAENLADARALAGLMETVDSAPKPVIGVVQGAAFGGGVGLVACCDMVVASEAARFCLSEVRLGIVPAVISPYVARAMGARACRRYFVTAELFGAAKARELGLVHEVVAPDGLEAVVEGWLAAIAANGPRAMTVAKDLARLVAERELDQELRDHTARCIADVRSGPEGREGIAAFLEKRKPVWGG